MTNTNSFVPSEIWTPDEPSFQYGEAIEAARREMNAHDPTQLIDELKQRVKRSHNGIVYAVLNGERPAEYSDTDALVMFNPFANTATANMLVRAEFIREVAKQADVRDEQGKLKPVIMLASPGLFGSKLNLSREDKKQISSGDLGPAAKEYLKTVTALDFGRIALLGYSQGADMAIASARSAYSANLDSSAMSIGDPASVIKREFKTLAIDFFNAAPELERRAAASGLSALDEARGIRSDTSRFLASAVYPINWLTFIKSLRGASFESNMQAILDSGNMEKIIVGYGENSTITPKKAIEPMLAKLHENIGNTSLVSIRAKNGTLAWGEQLTALAKLYLKALV